MPTQTTTTTYSEDTPDPKLARAKKTVRDFMARSEKYVRPYHEKFRKIFADYMISRAAASQEVNKSEIHPALSFQIIETFVPEMVSAYFADTPYCSTRARNPEFYQFEKGIEDFLTYECDEMGLLPKYVVGEKVCLMYGTMVVKTPWRKTTKIEVQEDGTKIPIKDYDLPDWINVNPFQFFPDPDHRIPGDIEGMKGCVHKVYRTYEALHKLRKRKLVDGRSLGIYSNLDKVKARFDARKDKDVMGEDKTGMDRFYDVIDPAKAQEGEQPGLSVEEYWGQFDPTGDGEEVHEYVITVVDGDIVIRCEDNPLIGQYKPFLATVDYPIPGEWYGAGEVEPVWSSLVEIKSMRNSRMKAVKLATNPVMIVDRTGGFNLKNIISSPGRLLIGNDVNALKPLDIGAGFLSAYREVADLEAGVQQAIALPSPGAGSVPGGGQIGRTEAGVQFLAGSAVKRLELKIRYQSAQAMEPFFKRLLKLNRQFLPAMTYFRAIGDKNNPFQMLPIEVFRHNWMVDTKVAMDRMTKSMRQANLKENIIPLLQLNEERNPMAFRWDLFIPQTLRDFDYRQADMFFRPQEEADKLKAQQMQQQMAMAQQNVQTQTQAQAMLGEQKGQQEMQQRAAMDETTITKTAIKGVLDIIKQDAGNEAAMESSVATAALKGMMDNVNRKPDKSEA